MSDSLSTENVAALLRLDVQDAYDRRRSCRKQFSEDLGNPTVPVQYNGGSQLAFLLEHEARWEMWAEIVKQARGLLDVLDPAEVTPGLQDISDDGVVHGSRVARTVIRARLDQGRFDTHSVGLASVWSQTHLTAARAFLDNTLVVDLHDARVLHEQTETDARVRSELAQNCGYCGQQVRTRVSGTGMWWIHVFTGTHLCADGTNDCNTLAATRCTACGHYKDRIDGVSGCAYCHCIRDHANRNLMLHVNKGGR